ncbi:MAG TPA: hypothetical protein VD886_14525 [Herpetosiphonaceae bacterium]|nr:hypothetical protein [Herpetosiphonaceae bacterium]
MPNTKQAEREPPAVPSAERYKDAFRQLRATLPANHLALLRAHYLAPNHTITARELAAAVGYAGHGSVNLQYGMFGRAMRELMAYAEGEQAAYVFASFIKPGAQGNREHLWVLHPEVVQALDELGWFAIQ